MEKSGTTDQAAATMRILNRTRGKGWLSGAVAGASAFGLMTIAVESVIVDATLGVVVTLIVKKLTGSWGEKKYSFKYPVDQQD